MNLLAAPTDAVQVLPVPAGPQAGRGRRRLNVRRLNGRAVALGNALRQQGEAALDWFDQPARARVADVRWIDEPSTLRHDLLIRVHWRGMDGHLGLSHPAAEAALANHLDVVPWDALPAPVVLALLQDGADRLMASPGLTARGPLRLRGLSEPRALTGPLFAIEVHVEAGAEGDLFRLDWLVNADTFRLSSLPWRLMHSTQNIGSLALFPPWSTLPVTVAFELGWVRLPLSEWQGIRVGDVLLPDHWWARHEQGRIGLRVGGGDGWRAGYAGMWDETKQRITVTGAQTMEQDWPEEEPAFLARKKAEDDDTDPFPDLSGDDDLDGPQDDGDEPDGEAHIEARATVAAPPLNAAALGDLPVRLTFDLGERSLTLHELTLLGVGHVFDLGLSARQAVNLRVNGLRVGEGEIVEIDGRIGVAVSRILPPRS